MTRSPIRARLVRRAAPGFCAAAIAAAALLGGCDSKPELDADHPETSPLNPLVPTTNSTAIELGGNQADQLRKNAEAGDVQAMLVLARFYESNDREADRAEALRWYQKAADKGDSAAAESVRRLNAMMQQAKAGRDAALDSSAPGARAATAPASAPSTQGSAVASDPNRIRWRDVTGTLDISKFRLQTNPNFKGKFIVLATAPDRTMTIAASGPTENDLDQVTMVIRVKNKAEPGTSPRVVQTSVIANLVTRDNVSRAEVIDWVSQYINTGQRLEPIFRNGWGITVTGTAAEGIKDPKELQGIAVMVELKR